jgi:hypothetical protein
MSTADTTSALSTFSNVLVLAAVTDLPAQVSLETLGALLDALDAPEVPDTGGWLSVAYTIAARRAAMPAASSGYGWFPAYMEVVDATQDAILAANP